MANVKVHFKEIIKYVLLLGLGIQIIFGVVIALLWLAQSGDFFTGLKIVAIILFSVCLAYAFLKSLNGKMPGWLYLLGASAVVSTPVVLQACLSINSENIYVYVLLVFFTLFAMLTGRIGKSKKLILFLCSFLVVGTCISSIDNTTSFWAKMSSRFCYPHLFATVANIPQEMLDEGGYIEFRDAMRSAEGVREIWYPYLMERYDDDVIVNQICGRFARYGLQTNTKNVISNIGWDLAGYNFPMVVSELQLKGYGYDGITGYHYNLLLDCAGRWGAVYWKYNVIWYALTLVIMAVCLKERREYLTKNGWITLLLVEFAAVCLTMQGAGLFDYTSLPVTQFLWMVCVLNCLENVMRKEVH